VLLTARPSHELHKALLLSVACLVVVAWASAQGVLATDAMNALAEYRDELNGPAATVAASPGAAR